MRKPLLLSIAAIALGLAAIANTPAERTEQYLRDSLPSCPGEVKIESQPVERPLPAGFKATAYVVRSASPQCSGQFMAVVTPRNYVYFGMPWSIGEYQGSSEQKIARFTWERFGETITASVDPKKNEDGLFKVKTAMTTEQGKIPMEGYVDAAGTLFFPGEFHPLASDPRKLRVDRLQRSVGSAPTAGAANAKVTLVEFSDFQCPSCKYASGFIKPLLEKYGEEIRYTRVDLPLMASHPWAFPAALMGRAIHNQSADKFWEYRNAIYASQSELTIFTLEDFVHGFVKDHGLDEAKFDQDIQSAEIKSAIIDGISAAYALQVNSTPTFLLNGQIIAAGDKGEFLEKAIQDALAR